MKTIDYVLIVLNLVLALAAFHVNMWATRFDDPRRRVYHSTKVGVLVIYCILFALLLFDIDPNWLVRGLRGLGLVAWPVAWMICPYQSTKNYQNDVREMEKMRRDGS